jgi:hypothetical protein
MANIILLLERVVSAHAIKKENSILKVDPGARALKGEGK